MPRKNNEISVNRGILEATAKKLKSAIGLIAEKDSLSAGDTKAIRVLADAYDILVNPVKENHVFLQEADKNNHH